MTSRLGETQTFPFCGACGWFPPGAEPENAACQSCGADLNRFWTESAPPAELEDLFKAPPTEMWFEARDPYGYVDPDVLVRPGHWNVTIDGVNDIESPIIYEWDTTIGLWWTQFGQGFSEGAVIPGLNNDKELDFFTVQDFRVRKYIDTNFNWRLSALVPWGGSRATQAGIENIVVGVRQYPGAPVVVELREVAGDALVYTYTARPETVFFTTPVITTPPSAGTSVYIRVGDGTTFQDLPAFIWGDDFGALVPGPYSATFQTDDAWGNLHPMCVFPQDVEKREAVLGPIGLESWEFRYGQERTDDWPVANVGGLGQTVGPYDWYAGGITLLELNWPYNGEDPRRPNQLIDPTVQYSYRYRRIYYPQYLWNVEDGELVYKWRAMQVYGPSVYLGTNCGFVLHYDNQGRGGPANLGDIQIHRQSDDFMFASKNLGGITVFGGVEAQVTNIQVGWRDGWTEPLNGEEIYIRVLWSGSTDDFRSEPFLYNVDATTGYDLSVQVGQGVDYDNILLSSDWISPAGEIDVSRIGSRYTISPASQGAIKEAFRSRPESIPASVIKERTGLLLRAGQEMTTEMLLTPAEYGSGPEYPPDPFDDVRRSLALIN